MKQCSVCGKEVKRSDHKFCSRECADKSGYRTRPRKKDVYLTCARPGCKNTFVKHRHKKFCSKSCGNYGTGNGIHNRNACKPETAQKLAALLYAISVVGPICEPDYGGNNLDASAMRRDTGLRRVRELRFTERPEASHP